MLRRTLLLLGGALVIAIAALAIYLFRPPAEASAPLAAVPVVVATATAPAPTARPEPTPAPAASQPTAVTAAPAPTAAPAAAEPQIFSIDAARSQARFLIDEVLRGAPFTVVGATSEVAGQIALDPANPAATQVGVIQINARTLATDSGSRDRAIKNVVLRTDEFELITFAPTAIEGLPQSVTIGQPFDFTISGDLTITDVTRPAVFTVTVTPISPTEIRGLATTSVSYRDFGLFIPDSPVVDTVADEVRLELEFVAGLAG